MILKLHIIEKVVSLKCDRWRLGLSQAGKKSLCDSSVALYFSNIGLFRRHKAPMGPNDRRHNVFSQNIFIK